VEKTAYDYCQLKIQLMAFVATATKCFRLEYETKLSLESSESMSSEEGSVHDPSEAFLASPTDENYIVNVNEEDEEEGFNRHEDLGEEGEVRITDNKETVKSIHIDFPIRILL